MAWTKPAFDNNFETILVPQSSPQKKIRIDMVLLQRNKKQGCQDSLEDKDNQGGKGELIPIWIT
jgi:hypothetical protein